MLIKDSRSSFGLWLFLGAGMLLGFPQTLLAEEGQQVLFDFDQPSANEWRSINDNVMGGISKGTSDITEAGILEFYGNLSLENRGGFASVRCRPDQLDLSRFSEIVLRVRGDGRTYYCNLQVPTNRIAYSYRAAFTTEPNQWTEIRIPLSQFRATWFGRTIADAPPVDPNKVTSMGFTIADKKAGPFKLETDWIKGD